MDLKEEDILGEAVGRHWYYRAKLGALVQAVGEGPYQTVLDVGAGSGFFSRSLVEQGLADRAVCVDPHYGAEQGPHPIAGGTLEKRRKTPEGLKADLILFMDVLEHVDDPHALLAGYLQHAAPGARVVVTLPAFQWMWSPHDDFLEHKKRYTRGEAVAMLKRAGLVETGGWYFYGALFPVAVARRLWARATGRPGQELRRHHPAVNAALEGACAVELPFMRLNRLAGLTVFAVGRVPG